MGLLGYVIVIAFTMCIPETIKENKHAGEELVAGPDDNEGTGRLTRIWHSVVSAFLNTIQSLRVVFLQDKKLGLLVLGSLFADLGTSLFNLLMQYATKRLNLQYREVRPYYSIIVNANRTSNQSIGQPPDLEHHRIQTCHCVGTAPCTQPICPQVQCQTHQEGHVDCTHQHSVGVYWQFWPWSFQPRGYVCTESRHVQHVHGLSGSVEECGH